MKDSSREQKWVRLVSGEERGGAASLARAGLGVLEPFYGVAVAMRNRLFDAGAKTTLRLPRPVISVGNLTVGGTGKTPLVAWLAHQLTNSGRGVAILTRGYRRQGSTQSDEVEMLRRALPNVRVLVNADRFAAASAALRSGEQIDVCLMDDGFQHRRLHRDLDLVVVDVTNPFGFGRLLPRGMLREPLRSLRRAHAVVLTRTEQVDQSAISRIETKIAALAANLPIIRSTNRLTGPSVTGKRIFAFAGIGNPEAFKTSLKLAGANVVGFRAFADHYPYSQSDLDRILSEGSSAEMIVTTAKDAVKLAGLNSADRIVVAAQEMCFDEANEKQLVEMVEKCLAS